MVSTSDEVQARCHMRMERHTVILRTHAVNTFTLLMTIMRKRMPAAAISWRRRNPIWAILNHLMHDFVREPSILYCFLGSGTTSELCSGVRVSMR